MTPETLLAIKEHKAEMLQDLRKEPTPFCGICYMVEEFGLLGELMTQWPRYSGDYVYPVPHDEHTPDVAYHNAQVTFSLWDKSTPYGQARHELRAWLITTLENLQ